MRTILIKANGRAAASQAAPPVADTRTLAPFLSGMVLSLGLAVLETPAFSGSHGAGAAISFWSYVAGLSGCVRAMAPRLRREGDRPPILRLACGAVSLLAWNQLVWLVFPWVAAAPFAAAGSLMIDAAVSLLELRSIYRAARDARSDHS